MPEDFTSPDDERASDIAYRIGRAVTEETQRDSFRFSSLAELIHSCREATGDTADLDEEGDQDPEQDFSALGRTALTAWRLCAEPELLDSMTEDERQEQLEELGFFLTFLTARRTPRLAPQPVTAYPDVITRFTDAGEMAHCWRAAVYLVFERAGPDAAPAVVTRLEERLAQLPPPLARQFDETFDELASRLPRAVGRSLIEEAERQSRRYPDLRALVDGIVDRPDLDAVADEESDRQAVAVGSAALCALGLAQDPEACDTVPRDTRAELLQGLDLYLSFAIGHKLWHLAPQPVSRYREILDLYEDAAARARVTLGMASVIRERGDLEDSLDVILTLRPFLSGLTPDLVTTFHAHTASTLRDLRRFDEAHGHYLLAEEAAAGLPDEERQEPLREIRHQRHRLSLYAGDQSYAADVDADAPLDASNRFNPNPLLPGSVFDAPERWRERPWQLLTLAQNAARAGDHWTAHRALTELADAAAPDDYDLLAPVHHELADLAARTGAPTAVVHWHSRLGLCARLLSGNHRELGISLSGQARRLASTGDPLGAYSLARWARAADRVPLYTGGVQADLGYVLYRNGSLDAARSRFDASLAVEETDLVRAQREMVGVLLGEDGDDGHDGSVRDSLRPDSWPEVGAARFRAAARLLSGPADDVHTWPDLLLHSKGDVTAWSPSLQVLLESFQKMPDDPPIPDVLGMRAVDHVKADVFETLLIRGLLGTLDTCWNIPPWAGAAWVLASDVPEPLRRQVGLEAARSATPAPLASAVIDDSAGLPAADPVEQRAVQARIDRLLALTFRPTGSAYGFGDARDAARLREWAAEFVRAHGRRPAFRLHDDLPTHPLHRPMQRGLRRFVRASARLPRRLQVRMATIELGKQMVIAAGPVRDVRLLEQVHLLVIGGRDGRRLKRLYDSRTTSRQLFAPHLRRQQAEVRAWFGRRDQATVDLLQGPAAAHLITCRRSRTVDVTVSTFDLPGERARSVADLHRLAPSEPVLRPADQAALELLTDRLHRAAGDAAEVSLRLPEPWQALPVENLPDATGRAVSQHRVVVRRNGTRPRFGAATRPLPRRARVLGDPMGGVPGGGEALPGSLEEAREVAALLGVRADVQDDATYDRLCACAAEAELLWLSTHCEAVPHLGGTPALRLRDRWILPAEIAALPLGPRAVVVLTVCAGGSGPSLGAVSGPPLAASFLAAGARLVISPTRTIRDSVWGPLIVEALRRTLRTGRATPAGLVRALNAMTPTPGAVGPWVMHA
ncbi:CHAT domain-containing protein [Streptomyces griseosporeus]|uniref:CHAT domain-containing protein n=1 Tax=Streptomyces griseosporeus TaxID=1910 RepID=UPI0036FD4F10